MHNKDKEGKELKTLFELFKEQKIKGTAESIHHSAILMLLCIGESPARGDYTLPNNLNFHEKIEKMKYEKQLQMAELEREIR